MEKKYFLLENGKASQPFSLDGLLTRNITSDTLVCVKFGTWKPAKDIPELAELLEWQPPLPSESELVPSFLQVSNFQQTEPTLQESRPFSDKDEHLNPEVAVTKNFISQYKIPLIIGAIIMVSGFASYLLFFSNNICDKEGEKFLGTWKNGEFKKIEVTRNTELFSCVYGISCSESRPMPRLKPGQGGVTSTGSSSWFKATYEDGFLKRGESVAITYSNGKIIYGGEEYENSNPAPTISEVDNLKEGNRSLTQSNGEKLLKEHLKLPKEESGKLYLQLLGYDLPKYYESLQSAGLVKLPNGLFSAELTDKGKQYSIGNNVVEGHNQYYIMVKTSKIEFDKITEIVENKETNSAKVNYNLIKTITPFGRIAFNMQPRTLERKVTFRKYDDGWRIDN